ncbi:hypothetical protein SAMN04515666_101339 [Bosea lupini]|uniref:Ribbon-helix-helix protein, copG family n=1 Tax=Bosea lupini TaxID=1036779 RepID=A0A1H7GIN7_9HYPH|nr:hypothetical protein [Bosea lupini]SEK36822.1 hypothetical protein SAMN04515666_101339 [Bosea lupini]
MPAPRKYTDRPAPTVAERQRKSRGARRARGEHKIEVWLSEAEHRSLQALAVENEMTIAEMMKKLLLAAV